MKITDFGLAVIRDEMYADEDGFAIDLDDDPGDDRPAADFLLGPAANPPSAETTAPTRPDIDPAGGVDLESARLEPAATREAAHLRLTQTGSLLGTLPYMAPEQFRDSKAVDIRADVYAFGIVLFQLLTGRLPFQAKTIARYDRAHERYVPPSVVPSIPRKYAREAAAIDAIVQRCLSKEPADRYLTMNDLRKALTAVARRVDPHFRPRK